MRSRALGSKRATRLTLVGTTAWIGYRDVEGDAVISEISAEADSMRGFGQRTLDPQVLLGRGSAPAISGWPAGDPTSFTGSRLNFRGNGMTQPVRHPGRHLPAASRRPVRGRRRHGHRRRLGAGVELSGGHMAMNRRGFTLISVMIAVVILAVGVLALSRTLTGAMAMNTRAGLRTVALDIARQRMEFLRAPAGRRHGATIDDALGHRRERGGSADHRRQVSPHRHRVADVRTNLVSVTVRVTYPNGTTPVELVTYVYTGAVT